jgi:hypothetical protein
LDESIDQYFRRNLFCRTPTKRQDAFSHSPFIEQRTIACLTKPFSDAAMLEALNSALRVK